MCRAVIRDLDNCIHFPVRVEETKDIAHITVCVIYIESET